MCLINLVQFSSKGKRKGEDIGKELAPREDRCSQVFKGTFTGWSYQTVSLLLPFPSPYPLFLPLPFSVVKVKVKGAMPQLWRRRGAHLPLAAVEPVGG